MRKELNKSRKEAVEIEKTEGGAKESEEEEKKQR